MKPSFANIRSILEISGPMTMREVAQFFPGVEYRVVASFITAMRKSVATKQVYIQSWTREGIGRCYPRPIYALGSNRDAPKISPKCNAQRQREKRQIRKLPKVANSVFQLGAFL